MPPLTRDAALGMADRLQREPISLPRLGGDCYAEELCGINRGKAQRLKAEWEAAHKKNPKTHPAGWDMAAAIVACQGLVTETGARIFQDGDEEKLARCGGADLDRAFEAIDRLSGGVYFLREDVAKNSEPSQAASGSSASPASTEAPSEKSSPDSPAAS